MVTPCIEYGINVNTLMIGITTGAAVLVGVICFGIATWIPVSRGPMMVVLIVALLFGIAYSIVRQITFQKNRGRAVGVSELALSCLLIVVALTALGYVRAQYGVINAELLDTRQTIEKLLTIGVETSERADLAEENLRLQTARADENEKYITQLQQKQKEGNDERIARLEFKEDFENKFKLGMETSEMIYDANTRADLAEEDLLFHRRALSENEKYIQQLQQKQKQLERNQRTRDEAKQIEKIEQKHRALEQKQKDQSKRNQKHIEHLQRTHYNEKKALTRIIDDYTKEIENLKSK